MTANTLRFGEEAQKPWDIRFPQKEPDEVKSPAIRGQQTHGMSNIQMELALHERKENYVPFILQKKAKRFKRKTCLVKDPLPQRLQAPMFPSLN
jgi:hypothetical protein